MLVRMPDSKFSLANFMRAQLYGTMATLRLGMNILFDKENVQIEKLLGHGGLFKTPVVGQKLMAGALNTPVAVMETAGEGGAWGIALLAAYMVNKVNEPLEDYLENLNPESLVILKDCKIDADLKDAKIGDSFQFMRNGYFTVDKYSTEDNVVFNLTATLKDSFKIQ